MSHEYIIEFEKAVTPMETYSKCTVVACEERTTLFRLMPSVRDANKSKRAA